MNENNMRVYDAVRTTPQTAQTKITDGDLKGNTNIKPQYRIEALTKAFGPIGIGWFYKVIRQEMMESPATQEVLCFVDIELFVKETDEWSQAIFGTGGSKLINNYSSRGIKSNDEAWKMATTDALSVACKQLGIGADVYWQEGENAEKPPVKWTEKATIKPVDVKPQAQEATQSPPTLKERIDGVCRLHKVGQETFGNVLKELQLKNKVANKQTADMTETEIVVMLKEVGQAIIDKKKEKQA